MSDDRGREARLASERCANYCHDDSPGGYAVRVCCIVCGQMTTLAHMVADLDGPAFKAYYHPECLPQDNDTA